MVLRLWSATIAWSASYVHQPRLLASLVLFHALEEQRIRRPRITRAMAVVAGSVGFSVRVKTVSPFRDAGAVGWVAARGGIPMILRTGARNPRGNKHYKGRTLKCFLANKDELC